MQIDIMSFTRRGIELSAKIRECLYSVSYTHLTLPTTPYV